jgi:hypothetical protein
VMPSSIFGLNHQALTNSAGERMEKPVGVSILCVLAFLSAGYPALAQWQPERKLTTNDARVYTSDHNGSLAANGEWIHAVWIEYGTDQTRLIYYRRSSDGGRTWPAPRSIAPAGESHTTPCVAVTGAIVHIAFGSKSGDAWNLLYVRSTDCGATWGPVATVSSGRGGLFPSLAASGTDVQFVYAGLDPETQAGQVFHCRSTDGGITWQQARRISDSPGIWGSPSLAVSGANVHVAWTDGTWNIYYRMSSDGGLSWAFPQKRLTEGNASRVGQSSLAVSDQVVHLAWWDQRIPDMKIHTYHRRSTDNGASWLPEAPLASLTVGSVSPSLAVYANTVHAVWVQTGDAAQSADVTYKQSLDGGATWPSGEATLSSDPLGNSSPSIAAGNSRVHVVWSNLVWADDVCRSDVFYRRNPSGTVVDYSGFWSTQVSGTTQDLFQVDAVDHNVAWVGGTTILRTVDGGTSWHDALQNVPGGSSITALGALDANVAVAAQAMGGITKLIRTTDGGQTWQDVLTGHAAPIYGIHLFRDRSGCGVAVGSPVNRKWIVLETADAGQTWRLMRNLPDQVGNETGTINAEWALRTLSFPSPFTVPPFGAPALPGRIADPVPYELPLTAIWIGTSTGHVVGTPQDGHRWFRRRALSTAVQSLWYSDILHGVAGGQRGLGGVTTNGGVNWTTFSIPGLRYISSVSGAGEEVWLAGGNRVFRSHNRGSTWMQEWRWASSPGEIRDISFVRTGAGIRGWAVTAGGGIATYFAPAASCQSVR